MRTTLEISDDVYREVKSMAALAGTTVTSLVEQALRDLISGARPSPIPPSLPRSYGNGGEKSGIDLSDNKAIRAILENEVR
jgi:hypothetical protein